MQKISPPTRLGKSRNLCLPRNGRHPPRVQLHLCGVSPSDAPALEHLCHCSQCVSWRSLGHIVSQVLGKMHRERMP